MSKTYILLITHIKMHIENNYSRLFTDAKELSFPKCWGNFDQQYFSF